jgi:hypothetical protein
MDTLPKVGFYRAKGRGKAAVDVAKSTIATAIPQIVMGCFSSRAKLLLRRIVVGSTLNVFLKARLK